MEGAQEYTNLTEENIIDICHKLRLNVSPTMAIEAILHCREKLMDCEKPEDNIRISTILQFLYTRMRDFACE